MFEETVASLTVIHTTNGHEDPQRNVYGKAGDKMSGYSKPSFKEDSRRLDYKFVYRFIINPR